MSVMLTQRAADEIQNIIKQQGLPEDQTRLRVGVKGGGCGGFSYILDLTEEANASYDEDLESNGVKIVIDNKSLLYLDGIEIDFKNEAIGAGFVFKNSNPTATCGCSSSVAK